MAMFIKTEPQFYWKPRTVFERNTSRREEQQSSILRQHTHKCPGRARRHLTTMITANLMEVDDGGR